MSKEGIATFKDLSMGSLCNAHKQEDTLNDLRVQWAKMILEIELENVVRRRFPGHSEGTYGRLARWIDELGFIGSDVRFHGERLASAIVSWLAAGAYTHWWNLPRQSLQWFNTKPTGESPLLRESPTTPRSQKCIGELARVIRGISPELMLKNFQAFDFSGLHCGREIPEHPSDA
jgi:hypothetical protein